MRSRSPRRPLRAPSAATAYVLAQLALHVHAQSPASEPVHERDAGAESRDLTELSLEELMNLDVEVTSASRHAQRLGRTPAAIFVLDAEDIRRSGMTSLPDLLRLVPGMEVARLDSSRWAVSARGFNDQFANKMQVLVDGRSAYTPLFSGVWWDVTDVPLQDVERIEVIRGPGAALWGANAVNGVINVITKDAASTQGTLVSILAGNEDRAIAYARHGGSFSNGAWRVWARWLDRDELRSPGGGDGGDGWDMSRAGFRLDLAPSDRDQWTIQGEAWIGHVDNRVVAALPTPPFAFAGVDTSDVHGWDLVSRWTRRLEAENELALQASVDHSSRSFEVFDEERTTADVDFQHRFRPTPSQELVWGLGLRHAHASMEDSATVVWPHDDRTDTLVSAFAQDELVLKPDRWTLTLGTKLEHNDLTGFELQPNARLLFTPDERTSWWCAVSHAVRTPSQIEDDIQYLQQVVPGAPNQLFEVVGNEDLAAEEVDAFELGWRGRPSDKVSLDVAAFYNRYSNLIAYSTGTPFPSGGDLVVPLVPVNGPSADTWGVEVGAQWAPRPDARFIGTWTHHEIDVSGPTTTATDAEGLVPENQYGLRAQHDLREDLDLDAALFYVDRLPFGDVDHYWRLDARLEYSASERSRYAIGVQNLLHDGELEFATHGLNPSNEVQTSFYFSATWSF